MQTDDEYGRHQIAVDAVIGIYDYERQAAQKLLFSVEARFMSPADHKQLDRLIEATIQEYCHKHQPLLLERMAYELGSMLAKLLNNVKEFTLVIEKPGAMPEAECSFVRTVFRP